LVVAEAGWRPPSGERVAEIGSVETRPANLAQDALRTRLLVAHTLVEQVGKIAESAGVSNHIVLRNAGADELSSAQQDFAGQLIIGKKLLQLGVLRARH
jgi:hypothetical protein